MFTILHRDRLLETAFRHAGRVTALSSGAQPGVHLGDERIHLDTAPPQERYRLGMATIIDVLASQISLEQAEVDIVRSRLDYLVAKAQIEALIGREL